MIHIARSGHWPAFSHHFLDGKSCAVCGSTKKLTAHHIVPYHIDPSRELDETNVIALCYGHHLEFGHLGDFRGCNETVQHDAKAWLKKRLENKKRIRGG